MPRSLLLLALLLLVATPAPGGEPRTLKLRFPRFTIPPGANIEACVLVRIPTRTPFDLTSWRITNRGAGRGVSVLHFLTYLYTGERLGDVANEAGRVVLSRACLDLGPLDRDHRQLIASGGAVQARGFFPPGIALQLAPVPAAPGGEPDGIGILLDTNWVNSTSRTRSASAKVVLKRARPHTVRRLAFPIFERTAELGLEVPPGTILSTEAAVDTGRAAWGAARPGGPAGDACVLAITGHMHKRGRFFGVDLIGPDGLPENPVGGPKNPFEPGREHFFAAVDYTDPGVRTFAPPLLLRADESLHYTCWDDNGVTRALRLGCEEVAGEPPGLAAGQPDGHPAKPCALAGPASPDCALSDPAYPGRTFTGACVEANLVAGPTADDEVCALAGAYYDAVPGAGCDVSGLPTVN